jgi:hypothetical protein
VVKGAEPFKPIVVELNDQFDKEPHKAELVTISYFSNPVEKKHDSATYRIEFPNAHLTWYKFQTEVKPVKRAVKIKNQFGEQNVFG